MQTTVYIYSSSSLHIEMIKLILEKKFGQAAQIITLSELNYLAQENSFLILDDNEYSHQAIMHYLDHHDQKFNRRCLILIDCERKKTIHSYLAYKIGAIVSYKTAYKELAEAMQHLLIGKIYFSEPIKTHLVEEMFNIKNNSTLTARELEIVGLIGQGLSAKEIAKQLKCSPMTINVHRANVKKKLGLTHNNHFIKYCIDSLNT